MRAVRPFAGDTAVVRERSNSNNCLQASRPCKKHRHAHRRDSSWVQAEPAWWPGVRPVGRPGSHHHALAAYEAASTLLSVHSQGPGLWTRNRFFHPSRAAHQPPPALPKRPSSCQLLKRAAAPYGDGEACLFGRQHSQVRVSAVLAA